MSTNIISQAANMNSHGIPNDLLPTLNSVTVVIVLPIMQHAVAPTLRRCRLPFRPIARMTVGFVVEAAAMAWITGLQRWIYASPPCYWAPRACPASEGGAIPNDVHVLTQIPVFVLEGIGETFSNPAGYEYAYTKAPTSIKTIVQAAFQLSSAGGSALALALAPTYVDPKLLVTFATLAGCMFVDAVVFHLFFRKENRRIANIQEEDDSEKREQEASRDIENVKAEGNVSCTKN